MASMLEGGGKTPPLVSVVFNNQNLCWFVKLLILQMASMLEGGGKTPPPGFCCLQYLCLFTKIPTSQMASTLEGGGKTPILTPLLMLCTSVLKGISNFPPNLQCYRWRPC